VWFRSLICALPDILEEAATTQPGDSSARPIACRSVSRVQSASPGNDLRGNYGLLGNRYRKDKLARCRELIGMPKLEPKAAAADKDYRETYETLTGVSLYQCPVCHRGHMVLVCVLQPITRVRVPIIIDTS
jgi:hypothetical protein